MKRYIPWWGKIITKLVLSKLPVRYRFWNDIDLFVLGTMDQPNYAYDVFEKHFNLVKPKGRFTSLELGPGDSLFSAMVSYAFGGLQSYLVDAGEFAVRDVKLYQAMANFLIHKELPVPELRGMQSLEEVLTACSSNYLVAGLSSLQTIPDSSVDFIWSQAVLEHVRRAEFFKTMRELRRVIREDGACSHEVDLKDHLGGGLNNLRFPNHIWEASFMAESGFYTNRIRYSEMLSLFRQAGFDVQLVAVNRWNKLPTPKSSLANEFKDFSDNELCISDFSVILRPIK